MGAMTNHIQCSLGAISTHVRILLARSSTMGLQLKHTQAPSMDTFRTCCSNVPHPCIHAYMYFCKFIPNRQGRLMKPGDMLMNGTELKSTKCAGRQDAVIYTSNTVCYAHTHRNRHINICMHIHIHKVTDTRAHRHIHIYIHTQMTTFYSWRQHCRLVCA